MAKSIRSGQGDQPDVPAGLATGNGYGPDVHVARPHEALLRVGRDLLREIARGERSAVMTRHAAERIREAGGYRAVRFLPGPDALPGADPSVIEIIVGVNGRQHGLLEIEPDPARQPDEGERALLEECADDMALSLHFERLDQERRETTVRIVKSEERFRQVFHQTNDAVLLYEFLPGNWEAVLVAANQNACEWLGYTEDELGGLHPADLIETEEAVGNVAWGLEDPGPVRLNATVRQREGTTTAEVVLKRFDLLGRTAMLVVARDISEELRLEEEQEKSLEQIRQNMEQFAILNDQIRNPVQVIIGLADMEGGAVGGQIIDQAYEIDEIVRQLDAGWLESAKVTSYLRRYGA